MKSANMSAAVQRCKLAVSGAMSAADMFATALESCGWHKLSDAERLLAITALDAIRENMERTILQLDLDGDEIVQLAIKAAGQPEPVKTRLASIGAVIDTVLGVQKNVSQLEPSQEPPLSDLSSEDVT